MGLFAWFAVTIFRMQSRSSTLKLATKMRRNSVRTRTRVWLQIISHYQAILNQVGLYDMHNVSLYQYKHTCLNGLYHSIQISRLLLNHTIQTHQARGNMLYIEPIFMTHMYTRITHKTAHNMCDLYIVCRYVHVDVGLVLQQHDRSVHELLGGSGCRHEAGKRCNTTRTRPKYS